MSSEHQELALHYAKFVFFHLYSLFSTVAFHLTKFSATVMDQNPEIATLITTITVVGVSIYLFRTVLNFVVTTFVKLVKLALFVSALFIGLVVYFRGLDFFTVDLVNLYNLIVKDFEQGNVYSDAILENIDTIYKEAINGDASKCSESLGGFLQLVVVNGRGNGQSDEIQVLIGKRAEAHVWTWNDFNTVFYSLVDQVLLGQAGTFFWGEGFWIVDDNGNKHTGFWIQDRDQVLLEQIGSVQDVQHCVSSQDVLLSNLQNPVDPAFKTTPVSDDVVDQDARRSGRRSRTDVGVVVDDIDEVLVTDDVTQSQTWSKDFREGLDSQDSTRGVDRQIRRKSNLIETGEAPQFLTPDKNGEKVNSSTMTVSPGSKNKSTTLFKPFPAPLAMTTSQSGVIGFWTLETNSVTNLTKGSKPSIAAYCKPDFKSMISSLFSVTEGVTAVFLAEDFKSSVESAGVNGSSFSNGVSIKLIRMASIGKNPWFGTPPPRLKGFGCGLMSAGILFCEK